MGGDCFKESSLFISISTVKYCSVVISLYKQGENIGGFFPPLQLIWQRISMFNCALVALAFPTPAEADVAVLWISLVQCNEGAWAQAEQGWCRYPISGLQATSWVSTPFGWLPKRMLLWAEETSRMWQTQKTGAGGFNQIVSRIIANYSTSMAQ